MSFFHIKEGTTAVPCPEAGVKRDVVPFGVWGSGSLMVQVGGELDLTVLLFKFSDALADEVEDLAVAASALVFGDLVELVVKNGVDLDAEVLVFLVSHNNHLKVHIF